MVNYYNFFKKTLESYKNNAIEFYLSQYKGVEVLIETNQIKSINYRNDEEISIKAGSRDKMGFYYSTNFDESEIKNGIEEAIIIGDISKMSLPLTKSTKNTQLNNIQYYKEFNTNKELTLILTYVREFLSIIKNSYPEVMIDSLTVSSFIFKDLLINSSDTEVDQYSKLYVADGLFLISNKTSSTPFNIIYDSSDSLEGLKINRYFKRIYRMPLNYIKRYINIDNSYQILLSPYAAFQLLVEPIVQNCCADNIINNESIFFENKNPTKTLISDMITIIDNNSLYDFFHNKIFDKEGNIIKKSPIIEKGEIKNILTNNLYKNKINYPYIHRAGGEIKDLNIIMPTNLIMKGGNNISANIIKNINKGLLIERFSGTINKTGNIIGILRPCYLIENGNIIGLCREVIISTRLRTIIKNIIEVSSDSLKYGYFQIPYVLLNNI